MYTIVKNQLAEISNYQDTQAMRPELKADAPRFDKLLMTIKNDSRNVHNRAVSTAAATVRQERFQKNKFFDQIDFKIGSRHRDNTPGLLDRANMY